jgi:hypothetical protein
MSGIKLRVMSVSAHTFGLLVFLKADARKDNCTFFQSVFAVTTQVLVYFERPRNDGLPL